jgi:hypothetical protein
MTEGPTQPCESVVVYLSLPYRGRGSVYYRVFIQHLRRLEHILECRSFL